MKISIKREQNNARISSAERENVRTKFKTMKNFLSMAALALVGAMTVSCSSDDNITDQPQQQEVTKDNVVTLTTTVGFDDAASTRALTAEGVKTFAVGETMAVIYYNGTSTVKAVSHALEAGDITNEGKNATFTFDLETPNKSASVLYIYPAAMAGDTGVDFTKLNTQEGTFDALQSKYDLCTNFGAWDGDNLPSLTLENRLAILAITLKDEAGTSDITSSITGLTLSDGTKTYNVNRSAVAGPIYVAIRPTDAATINVTATNGTLEYTKTLTSKTYDANNGYNVTWNMTKLTKVTWNSTNVFNDSHQMDVLGKGIPTPLNYEGITISFNGSGAGSFIPYSVGEEHNAVLVCFGSDGDSFTFTAPSGKKFTKIEIISNLSVTFTAYGDWTQPAYTKIVWSGTPANEVTLGGSNDTFANDLNSIVFTLEDE